MDDHKSNNNVTVTKDDKKSEVTIEATLEAEELEKHRSAATKHLGKNIELPGFRKGHVPENMIREKIGDGPILQEMADRALRETLPHILIEHKIDVIGRPNIAVTKLAPNNPLEFKVTAAVMPDITVPDYVKIAVKHNGQKPKKIEMSDKEIEDAITEIRTRIYMAEQAAQKQKDETKDTQEPAKPKEKDLPKLDDDFVKKLGEYKDVDDFKAKLTEEIRTHKTHTETEKHRAAMIEEIIKETQTTLPDILIEGELNRMLARFKGDVANAGMKFEDYLTQIKKTEEDLRKEWRTDAIKQATMQLVFNEIAKKESLTPDQEKMEKEIQHILSHHKDAKEENVRMYVASIMMNQEVIAFLEKQK